MRNRFSKSILFIFLILFLLFQVYGLSSPFYANLEINANQGGFLSFSGATNYKNFSNILNTREYTTIDKNQIMINITSKVNFTSYFFKFKYPLNAKINFIRSTKNIKITETNNQILITGFGGNEPIIFITQYSIKNFNFYEKYKNYLISILAFISVLIFFFIFKNKYKRSQNNIIKNQGDEETSPKLSIFLNSLTPRQQDIIDIIKLNKVTTQKILQQRLKIPKSSTSRNIKSLEIKKIIIINKIGTVKYISLNSKIDFV